ncbi:MAG: DUF2092 domain-containing protein [Hyphomicrobiales bacterium]|nr:DUF2092 domain-containing protein [Hyphomicrobiales bacterium]
MRSSTVVAALVGAGVSLFVTLPSHANEADAKGLFKAMSDYLVSQKAISFNYDAELEIVTSDLQKLGFVSSGSVTLNRPDKLRVTRKGGFADVELAYDGKNLGALGKNLNIYAKVPVEGTIDELIDTLRGDFGLEAPASDLLSSNPFEVMLSNVTDVKDLGSGVIGGKECDHLAFRTSDTDWQIWIAQGDKPYPLRFTITSKMMAQAPSYTIDVQDWKTGDAVAADDFQLKVGDAKEVQITEMSGLDEVPDLSGEGGAQ